MDLITDGHPEHFMRNALLGKSKLIFWLLETGADPNLRILGMDRTYVTPFTSILKSCFTLMELSHDGWTDFKDQIAPQLQQFFEISVDLRTTTLIYFMRDRGKPYHAP